MKTIITLAMSVLLMAFFLIMFAAQDEPLDLGTPALRLERPVEHVQGPGLDWLREHRAAIKLVVVEELEQAAKDMNDPAKMRSARSDAAKGVPLQSIGLLLGMAITTLVKAVITAIIYAVLWGVVIYLLKSYWLKILLVLVVYFGFQIAFTYFIARSAARGVMEKKACVT